ncbi:MAG: RNA polymerase sigma factor, partial [Pseudomonadota bacterium]
MSPSDPFKDELRRIYPRLWRFCLTLSGRKDAAEDLAQAASLRALENREKFTPGTFFDRWIFRIAQRIWLNELRAATVRRGQGLLNAEELELIDHRPVGEANIFFSQVLNEVMGLPEAQR